MDKIRYSIDVDANTEAARHAIANLENYVKKNNQILIDIDFNGNIKDLQNTLKDIRKKVPELSQDFEIDIFKRARENLTQRLNSKGFIFPEELNIENIKNQIDELRQAMDDVSNMPGGLVTDTDDVIKFSGQINKLKNLLLTLWKQDPNRYGKTFLSQYFSFDSLAKDAKGELDLLWKRLKDVRDWGDDFVPLVDGFKKVSGKVKNQEILDLVENIKAVDNLLSGTDNSKEKQYTINLFGIDLANKELQKMLEKLEAIVSKVREVSLTLNNSIAEPMNKAFNVDIVESWRQTAIDSLKEVKDSIYKTFSKNKLQETLEEYSSSDSIMNINRKSTHGRFERSFGMSTKTGYISNPSSFSAGNRTDLVNSIVEEAKEKAQEIIDTFFHSHTDRFASFSLPQILYDEDTPFDPKYEKGDLLSSIIDFKKKGIKYQLTKATDEVGFFDAQALYNDYKNTLFKDDTSIDKLKTIIADKREELFQNYSDNKLYYLYNFAKKYGNVGTSDLLSNLLEKSGQKVQLKPGTDKQFTEAFIDVLSKQEGLDDTEIIEEVASNFLGKISGMALNDKLIFDNIIQYIDKNANLYEIMQKSFDVSDYYQENDIWVDLMRKKSEALIRSSIDEFSDGKIKDYNHDKYFKYYNSIQEFIDDNPINMEQVGIDSLFNETKLSQVSEILVAINETLDKIENHQFNSLTELFESIKNLIPNGKVIIKDDTGNKNRDSSSEDDHLGDYVGESKKKSLTQSESKISELREHIAKLRESLTEENDLVTTLLFGEDGTVKSDVQMLEELKSEYNSITEDLSSKGNMNEDDWNKALEPVYKKAKAAISFGILNPLDMKDMKYPMDQIYFGQENVNGYTDVLSDDYFSIMGSAINKTKQLNSIKELGEEKYIQLLEEEKSLTNDIYGIKSSNKNVGNLDASTLESTKENALSQIKSLEEEKTNIDSIINRLNVFKQESKDAFNDVDNINIDRFVNDLNSIKEKIDNDIEAYKSFEIVQSRQKKAKETDIFEKKYDKTTSQKSEIPKELESYYDALWDEIYKGQKTGEEAINAFENKAKELGVTFDEVAKKWILINNKNEISSDTTTPLEQVEDKLEEVEHQAEETSEVIDEVVNPLKKQSSQNESNSSKEDMNYSSSSAMLYEINDGENLRLKLIEIIEAIDLKTEAFIREQQTVAGITQSEVNDLETLDGWLIEIKDTLEKIIERIQTINQSSLKIEIDDNFVQELSSLVDNIKEIDSNKLKDVLEALKKKEKILTFQEEESISKKKSKSKSKSNTQASSISVSDIKADSKEYQTVYTKLKKYIGLLGEELEIKKQIQFINGEERTLYSVKGKNGTSLTVDKKGNVIKAGNINVKDADAEIKKGLMQTSYDKQILALKEINKLEISNVNATKKKQAENNTFIRDLKKQVEYEQTYRKENEMSSEAREKELNSLQQQLATKLRITKNASANGKRSDTQQKNAENKKKFLNDWDEAIYYNEQFDKRARKKQSEEWVKEQKEYEKLHNKYKEEGEQQKRDKINESYDKQIKALKEINKLEISNINATQKKQAENNTYIRDLKKQIEEEKLDRGRKGLSDEAKDQEIELLQQQLDDKFKLAKNAAANGKRSATQQKNFENEQKFLKEEIEKQANQYSSEEKYYKKEKEKFLKEGERQKQEVLNERRKEEKDFEKNWLKNEDEYNKNKQKQREKYDTESYESKNKFKLKEQEDYYDSLIEFSNKYTSALKEEAKAENEHDKAIAKSKKRYWKKQIEEQRSDMNANNIGINPDKEAKIQKMISEAEEEVSQVREKNRNKSIEKQNEEYRKNLIKEQSNQYELEKKQYEKEKKQSKDKGRKQEQQVINQRQKKEENFEKNWLKNEERYYENKLKQQEKEQAEANKRIQNEQNKEIDTAYVDAYGEQLSLIEKAKEEGKEQQKQEETNIRLLKEYYKLYEDKYLYGLEQNRTDRFNYLENNTSEYSKAQAGKIYSQTVNTELSSYLKQLDALYNDSKYTDDYKNNIKDLKDEIIKLQDLMSEGLINPQTRDAKIQSISKIKQSADSIIKTGSKDEANILADPTYLEKYVTRISKLLYSSSGMDSDLNNRFKTLRSIIESMLNSGSATKEQAKNVRLEFQKLESELEKSGKTGKKFFDIISNRFQDMNAKYLAQIFSINSWINYLKRAVSVVVELDTAMTELKKVSDASTMRLSESFEQSTRTATELGSTITNVINATADWSRLGYSISDAEELARVSVLYTNVGDNMSIDTANEALISTLQGFQLKASDAESIVDKFNEVANNFAIDTAGIGEGLKRSSAAFAAANTDLSQSIALITAANTIAQDPDKVGNAFTTLSARIRGSKAELEALGEETDAYVESTSKLRAQVKATTGVDIMLDENTYKDIYTIVLEIGKVWNSLNDIDQAALLEALAGKRQSNILAGLLNNSDLLEEIYNTSENSEGSAMKEQMRYQESIQYSIDRSKAELQELASNILNSEDIKLVVDLFADLLKVINSIVDSTGGLPIIIFSAATALGVFKKDFTDLVFDLAKELGKDNIFTKIFNKEQLTEAVESTNEEAGEAVGESLGESIAESTSEPIQQFTEEELDEIFADEDMQELLESTGGVADSLSMSENTEEQKENTEAKKENTEEQKENTEAKKENENATNKQSESADKLTAKEKLAALATNILKQAILSLSMALLSLIATKIIEWFRDLSVETTNIKETAYSSVEDLKKLKKELSSQKKTIDDFSDEYKELADGVNYLGENISLSEKQFEKYNEITNQIADMFPEMISGWTEEGNAIISEKGNLEALTEAYKDNSKAKLKAFLYDDKNADNIIANLNAQKNRKNFIETYVSGNSSSNVRQIELYNDLLNLSEEELQQALDDAKNNRAHSLFGFKDLSSSQHPLSDILKPINPLNMYALFGKSAYNLNSSKIAATDLYDDIYNLNTAEDLLDQINARKKQTESEINTAINDTKEVALALYEINNKDDLSKSLQPLANSIINSLDAKMLDELKGDKVDWEISDIENWVDSWTNKLESLTNNQKIALNNIFEIDSSKKSIDDISDSINDFVDSLNDNLFSESDKRSIKLALGFDEIEEKQERLKNTVSQYLYDGKELNSLDDIRNKNIRDLLLGLTVNQVDSAIEILQKSHNEKEFIKLWNNYLSNIVKATEFSAEKFSEDVKNISSLSSLYSTFYEDYSSTGKFSTPFDISSIEELREVYGNATISFDEFERTLTSSESTAYDVQKAFDTLVSEFVVASDALDGLNKETRNQIVSQLELQGVSNADTIITEELAEAYEELANAGYEVDDIDFSDTGINDLLNSFKETDKYSEETVTNIAQLALQQLLLNQSHISTKEDVDQLINLAIAAGATAESLRNIRTAYHWALVGAERPENVKEITMDDLNLSMFGSSYMDKNKGKSGSETDWSDLLDKQIAYLEAKLDNNNIDFTDYLNQRLDLINDFYAKGKISADEYYKYLEETYENQISIYDKVVSAVEDVINDQIDDLNEQKDSITEFYQKQIDEIQEEIDALQDEYDKKKDLMELEKARYEAERARNQRTKKLYAGGQVIYTPDYDAVRDAENNLEEQELNWTISTLEKKIEDLQEKMDKETESIDKQIEALNEYLKKWQDVSKEYEKQQNKMLASQILGKDWEKNILDQRLDTLEDFKNNYIGIQEQMKQAAEDAAEAAVNAWSAGGASGDGKVPKPYPDESNDKEKKPEYWYYGDTHGYNYNNMNYKTNIEPRIKSNGGSSSDMGFNYNKLKNYQETVNPESFVKDIQEKITNPIANEVIIPMANSSEDLSNTINNNVIPSFDNIKESIEESSDSMYRQSSRINMLNSILSIFGTSLADIIKKTGGNPEYISKSQNLAHKLSAGAATKFAKGGVISDDNNFLSSIAQSMGEDTMVAVKHGERVLTPIQNENFEKLVNLSNTVIPQLQNVDMFKSLRNQIEIPNLSSAQSSTVISIGDIHLHEVNDVDGLSKAIITQLPSKFMQAINK